MGLAQFITDTHEYFDAALAVMAVIASIAGVITWLNRLVSRQIAPVLAMLEAMRLEHDVINDKLDSHTTGQGAIAAKVEKNGEAVHHLRRQMWIIRQHQRMIGRQVEIPLEDIDDEDAE